MILPGHIAVAIFCHRLLRLDLSTLIAAALLPDAVDKGLAHVLRVTPSGRYAMHSLPGWLFSSLAVGLWGGEKRRHAWAVGHLAHLLGDPGQVPWWFPFKQYEFPEAMSLSQFLTAAFGTAEAQRSLALETLLLILALLCPRAYPIARRHEACGYRVGSGKG